MSKIYLPIIAYDEKYFDFIGIIVFDDMKHLVASDQYKDGYFLYTEHVKEENKIVYMDVFGDALESIEFVTIAKDAVFSDLRSAQRRLISVVFEVN